MWSTPLPPSSVAARSATRTGVYTCSVGLTCSVGEQEMSSVYACSSRRALSELFALLPSLSSAHVYIMKGLLYKPRPFRKIIHQDSPYNVVCMHMACALICIVQVQKERSVTEVPNICMYM